MPLPLLVLLSRPLFHNTANSPYIYWRNWCLWNYWFYSFVVLWTQSVTETYHKTTSPISRILLFKSVRREISSRRPYVQTQGAAAQLTKRKRFHRSFELSEGDVRLLKLFGQTVPQHWPSGGKTAVTGCVISWPSTFDCQQTTEDGGSSGNQCTFVS